MSEKHLQVELRGDLGGELHGSTAYQMFLARQRECAERLHAAEEDIERLGEALEGAMNSLSGAFSAVAGELGGRGEAALDAVVTASQFQDVGGQWIAHLGAHLRHTRQLLCESGAAVNTVHTEAAHPVANAKPGSVELF